MKSLACILFLFLVATEGTAQHEVFDIFRYTPPAGWVKEVKDNITAYTKTNNQDNTWCIINIVKSTASKGSIDKDFESEWAELAVRSYKAYGLVGNPVLEKDGWRIKSGTGKFNFNNSEAATLITTFSGYGRCASLLVVTNTERYTEAFEKMLASLELIKPDQSPSQGSSNVVVNTSTPVNSSFTFSTTNFDDGWVSVVKENWVQVTRKDLTVYLWYALPYDVHQFSGTGLRERDYYWDNMVSKYFTIQTKQYRDNGEVIGSLQPNYVEGWAIDKQTGSRRFIAMRLNISPNSAYIYVVSAPNENVLMTQFPNANGSFTSDLSDMGRYNKFAIAEKDVLGTWSKGNSSTLQWYYVTPSGYEGYAGMTVAATSSTYNFNPGGSYTSIHNGATGTVGNLNTFQQNYKGTYSVTPWTITATNRFEGRTVTFNAWFEVVRGGRVLHLQDQKYTGDVETLVKTK